MPGKMDFEARYQAKDAELFHRSSGPVFKTTGLQGHSIRKRHGHEYPLCHDISRWFIERVPQLDPLYVRADDILGYGKQADPENFWYT